MSTLAKAIRNKELRKKFLYVLMILVIVRIMSQIPVPGADPGVLKGFLEENAAFGMLNAFTGGGFSNFSILALSITPYITASIITQLFTIAFTRFEELSKDGETGRKKLEKITQYITVFLALIQSGSIVYGFRNALFTDPSWIDYVVAIAVLTAGSMITVWFGSRITEKGIGNGISMILLINILSRTPQDISILYESFIKGKVITKACMAEAGIVIVVCLIIVLTFIVNTAVRKIPVQYSGKTQGRRFINGETSNIPMKVNTGGVIPVIFATSIMAMPSMIAAMFRLKPAGYGAIILDILSPLKWFDPKNMLPTVGFAVYALLVILFAYYYTTITFNPAEIAENLRKSGAFIPGIRPGKPTEGFLKNICRYIILWGAAGLILVCVIPYVICGVTGLNVSLGGTSLIIICSIICDSADQVKSFLQVKTQKTYW